MIENKKTIAVALSGGIDSSYAAIILKNQGWNVVGVHLVLPIPDKEKKISRIRSLADGLNITFHLLDVSNPFKKNVIDYFFNSYHLGMTPNPCVVCNYAIKFEQIIRWMDQTGIDYLATGHYARLKKNADGKSIELIRAKDRQKDQTYFLHRVKKSHLSRSLFPIGDITKSEIYASAKEKGLSWQTRKESQEICFIPGNDYRASFKRYVDNWMVSSGNILDLEGNILGTHSGTYAYTIGQRHGLGIASPYPLYVHHIKPETNEIVVTKRENLFASELTAKDFIWIREPHGKKKLKVQAQIRYRHKPAEGTLTILEGNRVRFEFDYPQWAITPGQALVCYEGESVIGGGWISKEKR